MIGIAVALVVVAGPLLLGLTGLIRARRAGERFRNVHAIIPGLRDPNRRGKREFAGGVRVRETQSRSHSISHRNI